MTAFAATLDRFRNAVSDGADVPLARAALLVAQSAYPDLDVDASERRLDDIGETLRQQLQRGPARDHAPLRGVHALNALLYRELGFRGNTQHYDDPRNLCLNYVLAERTGIPVTLAIVYIEVARRVGMDVRAVGLPGHLVARYRPRHAADEDGTLLDVFNRGRLLSTRDCQVLVRNTYGAAVPFKPHYLTALTSRQLLQRLLHNMKANALQRGDEERAAHAIDLLLALFPWDLDEIRDRGMLRERLGAYPDALRDLEQYVQYRAGARDIHTVTETVRSLRRHARSADEDR